MRNTQPLIDPAAHLELREAALALDVHKSTVLRWTRTGKLRCGIKRLNGRKYWTGAELIRFWRAEY
ncbi:MAG: helix-turn-helix domain-containing protein [Bacteroidales bacterium]|jgi:predicted site-specific integrase-resolvase|nr:helix-turn-helix domain-containing protein [Bacteroidales bacterium]